MISLKKRLRDRKSFEYVISEKIKVLLAIAVNFIQKSINFLNKTIFELDVFEKRDFIKLSFYKTVLKR